MFTDYGIDAILVSQPDNRFYLSGFRGSAGYLLVSEKKAVLATDFRYVEQALNQAPEYEILRITSKIKDWFPGLLKDTGAKRLGFEAEFVSLDMYKTLQESILPEASGKATQIRRPIVKPGSGTQDKTIELDKKNSGINAGKSMGIELIPVTGMVEKLREIKEPSEIEYIKKAVEIADIAFEKVSEIIEAGMTEKQVAWEMEKTLRENGSEAIPFEIIVASGPNAALPHAQPSSRPIKAGEPVVIDIGARVEGYTSDLSRTVCLGDAGETFKKVYDTVLGAQAGSMAMLKEGMTGGEADRLARTIIEEGGYAEAFGHGLGHGVGLATHENPRLGPDSPDSLAEGMVFTIEPGIYIEGWGGVRIEDLVVMEKGKVREISKAKK